MKKIIGVLFISTILVGCTNNNNEVSNNEPAKQSNSNSSEAVTTEVTSETAENNEPQTLKMNEDLILGDGDKEMVRIKITEATTNQSAFPSHMISLDDYNTKKMIAVKIDYTNVAMDEPFLPHSNYFQAYDKNGKALKQVNQQNGQDAVAIGRTGTTQLFWELNEDGNNFNEVEIDFITDKKLGTFDLNVSH